MQSPAAEEYLEAIFKLNESEGPVKPSRLASSLGISQASVTEMVRRLTEQDLASKDEDNSIRLTEKGRRTALKVVRRHRLAERFLTDILGFSWDTVHDQACRLEHAMSQEMEDGLDRLLEYPDTCPHGHPIPNREGEVASRQLTSLASLAPGKRAVIAQVSEDDPAMLQYLASLGLLPDTEVTVEEIAPFGGPIMVAVDSARYAIGRELASKIQVTTPTSSPQSAGD
ncbi:MAG: metal-dependent transcriptional regulator [Clostridia bacterium]|nr:metal-dependent transcriptional regulator [Clostridia bacterium]